MPQQRVFEFDFSLITPSNCLSGKSTLFVECQTANGFHICPITHDLTPGRHLSTLLLGHRGQLRLFKILWSHISQSRMESLLIVDFLEKIRDPVLHILYALIIPQIHLLIF